MPEQDFAIVTGPIRAGATPVHIYNDGLTVFLYDESSADHIRAADPKILEYSGADAFEDGPTKSLLSSGALLLYGLHGDGGVDVEIVVGAPLEPSELAGGSWLPVERGFLRAPSGRVWVHSYNTLPMGDNEGEDMDDEGIAVDVPPGDYEVRLYRKDWDRMEQDGIDLDDAEAAGIDVYDGGRIDDVIVLTPTAAPIPPSTANILFRDCIE